jgi:hypothetical protein
MALFNRGILPDRSAVEGGWQSEFSGLIWINANIGLAADQGR